MKPWHRGVRKLEKTFLLKTLWSYPLKFVIFRAGNFKAHDAMVSSRFVILNENTSCARAIIEPWDRDFLKPEKISKKTFLLKTPWSYPLKFMIFRAGNFKAHDAMVSSEIVVLDQDTASGTQVE